MESVSLAEPIVPPSGIARLPLRDISPLVLLVIASSFSRIMPADPVISILVLATIVVAVRAAVAKVPPL
jgi:hypothetical protein